MSNLDLECTLEEAKSICRILTVHISNLRCASDILFMSAGKTTGNDVVRPAYVLTLLALEETGKMFKIWQAGADAENRGASEMILVKGLFRNHELKGGLASDLCCQILDWGVGTLDQMQRCEQVGDLTHDNIGELRADFSKAAAHLKEVYLSFKTEREVTMYVSADNDVEWNRKRQLISEVIESENALLWFVANLANSYLKTSGSFGLAVKALRDIRNGVPSDQVYAFYGRLFLGFFSPGGACYD